MPNPTVASRGVKVRVWFFAAGCRFYTMSHFFCKLHRDMNRVNVFAIHRCINEGYGLIPIFTEKIRISPHDIVACLHTHLQTCQVSRNFRESPEMGRDLQVSRNCKENSRN